MMIIRLSNMKKISYSKLDPFYLYVTGAWNGWMTEDRVIERLTQKPSPDDLERMKTGSNVHKYLSGKKVSQLNLEQTDNLDFFLKDKPDGYSEVFFSFNLYEDVWYRGYIDKMYPANLVEYKTTAKNQVQEQFYIDSLQWQIYCFAKQYQRLTYEFFSVGKDGDRCDHIDSLELNVASVGGFDKIKENLIYYTELFIKWLKKKDLMYLIEKNN